MSKLNYFYLPKELLSKEFSDLSLRTKLLFAIIITEADSAKSINEVASLIDKFGPKVITQIYNDVQREIKNQNKKSEGV